MIARLLDLMHGYDLLLDLMYGFGIVCIMLKVAPSLLLIQILMLHYSLQIPHHVLEHDNHKGLFHFFEAVAKYSVQ